MGGKVRREAGASGCLCRMRAEVGVATLGLYSSPPAGLRRHLPRGSLARPSATFAARAHHRLAHRATQGQAVDRVTGGSKSAAIRRCFIDRLRGDYRADLVGTNLDQTFFLLIPHKR